MSTNRFVYPPLLCMFLFGTASSVTQSFSYEVTRYIHEELTGTDSGTKLKVLYFLDTVARYWPSHELDVIAQRPIFEPILQSLKSDDDSIAQVAIDIIKKVLFRLDRAGYGNDWAVEQVDEFFFTEANEPLRQLLTECLTDLMREFLCLNHYSRPRTVHLLHKIMASGDAFATRHVFNHFRCAREASWIYGLGDGDSATEEALEIMTEIKVDDSITKKARAILAGRRASYKYAFIVGLIFLLITFCELQPLFDEDRDLIGLKIVLFEPIKEHLFYPQAILLVIMQALVWHVAYKRSALSPT